MKSVSPYSLPAYIPIVFAIGAILLVGNALYSYDNLSLVQGGRFFDGGRKAVILGIAGDAIVLAALVLFYRLIKRSFDKQLTLERELLSANDKLEANVFSRTAQLSALSRHLMQVTEEEKTTLAHALHSEFGACFSVITMDISVVVAKLGEADAALTSRLQRAMTTMEEVIALNRQIIGNLRPNMLDSLGLSFSLSEYANAFAGSHGVAVHTDIGEDGDQIDPACAIALFRIAQESMRNIAQHASASNIWVTLHHKEAGMSLSIIDDGKGIALDALHRPNAHGLAGMRERTMMLGGTLTVRHGPHGRGTEIEATIPLSPAPVQ